MQIALTLLCYHIINLGLSRFEIIVDTLHLIFAISFGHYWIAYYLFSRRVGRVWKALCEDRLRLHILGHILGPSLPLIIIHGYITIIIDHLLSIRKILHN